MFKFGNLAALKLANLSGVIDTLDRAELAQLRHLPVEVRYFFLKQQIISSV